MHYVVARHRRCRLRAAPIYLGVLLLALLGSRPAHGQGTSGTLPDPISARELTRYEDRLQLSPQQRQAAEVFHDQYKREFRALREGEIADFLKEMRSLNGAGTIPKRDVMEKFLRRMDQLNRKIEEIDTRFFDQVQTVLTPEQLAMMPRVRLARQRDRYMAQEMLAFGVQGVKIDLSQILYDMDLSVADRQAVDSAMAAYESRLTHDLQKLYESATRMMMDMFDALEKAGFTEQSMTDPETAQKMGELMQNLWQDLTRKAMEQAHDINELNHKTSRSVASVLPAATARALIHKYYEQAYPEAGFSFAAHDMLFNAVMRLKGLSDEQRQAVAAQQEDLNRKSDQLAEETIMYLDQYRADRSPFDADMGNWQEHQKKLTDFQSREAALTQAAVDSLKATLGADLFASIPKAVIPRSKEQLMAAAAEAKKNGNKVEADAAMVEAEGADAQGAVVAVAEPGDAGDEPSTGPDTFLPPAITQREMADYAVRLKLTDDQKSVLEGLFEHYTEQFGSVSQEEIQKLTKAQQGLWHYDEASGVSSPPTESQVDDTYRLRTQALEAVNRVDQQFFTDIQGAVLTEAQQPRMEQVQQARQRVVYNRGTEMWGAWGGSSEAGVDLGRMVRQQRLSESQLAAVETELAAYEMQAAAAFKAKYDAALDVQKAQEKWNARMQKAQADGGNAMQLAMQYKDALAEPQKKLREASQAISALNHQACEKLVSLLPAEAGNSLRNAYNRRAFPSIYNDSVATHDRLETAMKLTDLTDDQRAKINEISAEYRVAYTSLSEQMVEATTGAMGIGFGMGFDQADWQKWQERQDAMAKLAFDRNELSLKALRQLKAALNEAQIERLGGLPEPKVSDSKTWY